MTKKTLVNFVLDETGSMLSCLDQTIDGYNEYVNSLRDKKGFSMMLTKFNSQNTNISDAKPVKKVPKLAHKNYQPASTTPLYDAIGRSIRAAEKMVSKKSAVLCVVMTDGYENASKEYTREGIFELIKKKEKDGWQFAYLGANQDAWAVGATLGIDRGNTMTYDTAETKKAFQNVSSATLNYAERGSTATSNFFVDSKTAE